MGLGRRLMRAGTPEGELGAHLLPYVGRLRTDVVRFCAGREAHGAVRLEGASVAVEVTGRDAGFVARQIARRVLDPLRAIVEDGGRGCATVRITEASDEGQGTGRS
jgi:hypothetical protein